jgi:prepilin-type N-terminal cleavage/methylation domain-containing protein
VGRGFSLIEVLVTVVVIGIGFSIILFTTSNIEDSVIGNNVKLKSYFDADNIFNLYILDKAYNINYLPDSEDYRYDDEYTINTDSSNTFFDKLELFSVDVKSTDEKRQISIGEYVLKNER